MIAIGIDPSVTHTGVLVIDETGVRCAKAVVTKSVSTWQEQARRLGAIGEQIEAILFQWAAPDATIFVEDYAIGGGYASTIIPQVELGGVLRMLLVPFSLLREVHFVAPSASKKFATGKGNANKVEVAAALARRFGVDFAGDDNLFDAYSLARMALASMGHTEGLTKEQIAVVQKVIAPKVKKGAITKKV